MKPADKLWVFLAEGFAVGRIPWAPGTFGSILGLGWAWMLLRYSPNLLTFLLLTLGGILAAVWIGHKAEKALAKEDPGQIVIDEICAIPVACLILVAGGGILDKSLLEGSSWPWWVGVFAFFRLFDIWKPWPVKQIQEIPKGVGLVLDDVLAAGYVNLALYATRRAVVFFQS